MPEQIWDAAPVPALGLTPGRPSGSAMPLVWAHAEFLKLLFASEEGRPLEMLEVVSSRFLSETAERGGVWHWRPDVPFDSIPHGRRLLVDLPAPFTLHFGFDGWMGATDRPSNGLPFGRHGVPVEWGEVSGHQHIEFTIYYHRDGRWAGRDYRVRLGVPQRGAAKAGQPATGGAD
jgi:glucoamylase